MVPHFFSMIAGGWWRHLTVAVLSLIKPTEWCRHAVQRARGGGMGWGGAYSVCDTPTGYWSCRWCKWNIGHHQLVSTHPFTCCTWVWPPLWSFLSITQEAEHSEPHTGSATHPRQEAEHSEPHTGSATHPRQEAEHSHEPCMNWSQLLRPQIPDSL